MCRVAVDNRVAKLGEPLMLQIHAATSYVGRQSMRNWRHNFATKNR